MDPLAIYGVGAGLGALGSFFGGKSQADAILEANKQNAELTRESWERDDNAVFRRTQDLIRSGLNPALAAGSGAGTSSPLPMQAAAQTGAADAMRSAGASIAAWPTVEQGLKRSAAATLQAESSAALTNAQARIARHDAHEIENNRDPRDKSVIGDLMKGLPKIVDVIRKGTQGMAKPIEEYKSEVSRREAATSRKSGMTPAERAQAEGKFHLFNWLDEKSKGGK